MKKSKRKKMIKKLANKHFDYMDRDSQIRYVLERFYDNMSDRFLKKCYRENIGKLENKIVFHLIGIYQESLNKIGSFINKYLFYPLPT